MRPADDGCFCRPHDPEADEGQGAAVGQQATLGPFRA